MFFPLPRFSRVSCLIAVALIASACTSRSPSAPAAASAAPAPAAPLPNTIIIDNFTFTPAALTIAPGTTLTWINRDDVPHTVTSATSPRTLNSPTLDTDGRFEFTFQTPGSYADFCAVHPHMTGTITVK